MARLRGLTLGKYAPFHLGHQLVIDTALEEVDDVLVIIYDSPEVTSIPLPVRAQWIKSLYPQVEVIEAWAGPSEVGYSEEIKRSHEDYIINTLGISSISHFYSSEPYGEHMSIALDAIDRRIDQARARIPISASQLRANPGLWQEFVHPIVYKDLISWLGTSGDIGR